MDSRTISPLTWLMALFNTNQATTYLSLACNLLKEVRRSCVWATETEPVTRKPVNRRKKNCHHAEKMALYDAEVHMHLCFFFKGTSMHFLFVFYREHS